MFNKTYTKKTTKNNNINYTPNINYIICNMVKNINVKVTVNWSVSFL